MNNLHLNLKSKGFSHELQISGKSSLFEAKQFKFSPPIKKLKSNCNSNSQLLVHQNNLLKSPEGKINSIIICKGSEEKTNDGGSNNKLINFLEGSCLKHVESEVDEDEPREWDETSSLADFDDAEKDLFEGICFKQLLANKSDPTPNSTFQVLQNLPSNELQMKTSLEIIEGSPQKYAEKYKVFSSYTKIVDNFQYLSKKNQSKVFKQDASLNVLEQKRKIIHNFFRPKEALHKQKDAENKTQCNSHIDLSESYVEPINQKFQKNKILNVWKNQHFSLQYLKAGPKELQK